MSSHQLDRLALVSLAAALLACGPVAPLSSEHSPHLPRTATSAADLPDDMAVAVLEGHSVQVPDLRAALFAIAPADLPDEGAIDYLEKHLERAPDGHYELFRLRTISSCGASGTCGDKTVPPGDAALRRYLAVEVDAGSAGSMDTAIFGDAVPAVPEMAPAALVVGTLNATHDEMLDYIHAEVPVGAGLHRGVYEMLHLAHCPGGGVSCQPCEHPTASCIGPPTPPPAPRYDPSVLRQVAVIFERP